MSNRQQQFQVKKCAEWLAACLHIGWKKSDLDWLEKIWWKYHPYKPKPAQRIKEGEK